MMGSISSRSTWRVTLHDDRKSPLNSLQGPRASTMLWVRQKSTIYCHLFATPLKNRPSKSMWTTSQVLTSTSKFCECRSPSPKTYPIMFITASERMYRWLARYQLLGSGNCLENQSLNFTGNWSTIFWNFFTLMIYLWNLMKKGY